MYLCNPLHFLKLLKLVFLPLIFFYTSRKLYFFVQQTTLFTYMYSPTTLYSRSSVVSIATSYGLEGPGLESN